MELKSLIAGALIALGLSNLAGSMGISTQVTIIVAGYNAGGIILGVLALVFAYVLLFRMK